MNAVICSLATANPGRYVNGQEAYDYFKKNWRPGPEEDQLYRKVLLKDPAKGRYIAVEHDTFSQLAHQDELIELFKTNARKLSLEAARKALHQAKIEPADIKAVIINTCTGYLCPGLSSYLVEDLKLGTSTKVFDLMGMGCGAAIPNLEFASSFAANHDFVLSIAVEICSATIFNSQDPGCVISNCIFADGAAAAVVSNENSVKKPLVKILDFQTGIFPQYRDQLKYVSDQGKLRNVLSTRVPVIGARSIFDVTSNLLKKNNLSTGDIRHWAIHPGGTAVLQQVQKQLKLSDSDMEHSLRVFETYGNMSSPSVLFVLKSILDDGDIKPGQLCCALAFGAGFTAHSALLQIV